MNLPDYFEPVDFIKITAGHLPLGKYGLSHSIEKNSREISESSLSKADVVLMGVPVDNGIRQNNNVLSSDFLRRNLYRLASFDSGIKIVDLGNLKEAKSLKGTLLAIRDVTEYLRTLNSVVIILGGSQDLTLGICDVFRNERFFWLTVVDAILDVKKGTETYSSQNFLTQLFRKMPQLFQFSLVGYQSHLVGDQLMNNMKDMGSHLRLGELRDDISKAELVMRNTSVLSFDMGALKNSPAVPGTMQKRPNGLSSEEACQLAHYAGLSSHLSVFGLFEIPTVDDNETSASIAGEIIWYFIKGVSGRKQTGLRTAYKVEIEGLDQPLIFKHEWELNRWWFDVQSVSGEVVEIACSEEEYKKAASNEIPERWLRFLQKMDKLPK